MVAADLSARRRLLLTVLDAVYVGARGARAVVRIRPKVAYEAVVGELRADRELLIEPLAH